MPALFMVSLGAAQQAGRGVQPEEAPQRTAWPFLVTLYDCAVGHPDCSHCQAASGSLGCLWCSHDRPTCRYGPLCPPGAVELLCPAPSIDAVSPQPSPTAQPLTHPPSPIAVRLAPPCPPLSQLYQGQRSPAPGPQTLAAVSHLGLVGWPGTPRHRKGGAGWGHPITTLPCCRLSP